MNDQIVKVISSLLARDLYLTVGIKIALQDFIRAGIVWKCKVCTEMESQGIEVNECCWWQGENDMIFINYVLIL